MDRRAARRLVCGLIPLLLAAAPPAAVPDPYREVSLALAQELVALFPAAEGYVVSAGGGEAFIDLSRRHLLQPGMELQIFRPGEEMVHPVTKQHLGFFEEHLGYLRLVDVRETYSRGQLDAAGAAANILPGDRARISARRLRVLLHVAGDADGVQVGPLAQALLARGEQSGRFAMLDEPAWAPALAAQRVSWESARADPAALRRLGEGTSADLLWSARIEAGTDARVTIEVRSLRSGAVLAAIGHPWPKTPPAPADAPGEYAVRELMRPARSLAAGDVLGEGQLEVLLTDGSRLALYRWEPTALVWRWDEDGPPGRRIVSLDVADLDGDGRSDVLVTSVRRGRVLSEIRSWRDGAMQEVARIEGLYLRAIPRAGAPAALLGQRAGIGETVAGPVGRYRLRDRSVEQIEDGALPGGLGIFGMALAPGGGPVVLYALDRAGGLVGLSREGTVLWRGPSSYDGRSLRPPARDFLGSEFANERGSDRSEPFFEGRLLAGEVLAGTRLIVSLNVADPPGQPLRPGMVAQGRVAILEGPPTNPEEVRRSHTFDGVVADLALAGTGAGGEPQILFIVNRFAGPLLGERGKIVLWRPPGTPSGTPAGAK